MPAGAEDEDGGSTLAGNGDANENKYLRLEIPAFATDPAGDPDGGLNAGDHGAPMTSFLRLGAASLELEPGDELVPYAFMSGPAGTQAPYEEDPADFSGDPANVWSTTVFIDDERNRGAGNVEPAGASGHGMTPAERRAWHTHHLLGRGGFRDHADGNRVTTTYGDKLEVIRGNYKLVVLGRQDDAGNGMGFDMSGNHLQDFAQATMPGASVTVEWIQNAYVPSAPLDLDGDLYSGGAWLLINSTERVYQTSRNAGSFREQVWGEKNETYTGSENPKRIGESDDDGYQGHPTDGDAHAIGEPTVDAAEFQRRLRPSSKGLPRGNPHIIDKTWATKIEGYTGSRKLRVPEIVEQTWAQSATSTTDVLGAVTDTTNIVGAQTSTTDVVGPVTETTSITGPVTTTTTVLGPVTEITTVGIQSSVTTAAAINEVTTVTGPKGSLTNAISVEELTNAANVISTTNAGTNISLSYASVGVGVGIAVAKASLDLAAFVADITVAVFKLSGEANLLTLELYAGIKYELEASEGKVITPKGEEVTMTKTTTSLANSTTCVKYSIN